MSATEVVSVAVDVRQIVVGVGVNGPKRKAATMGKYLAGQQYPHLTLGAVVHVELDAIEPGVAEVLVEVLRDE